MLHPLNPVYPAFLLPCSSVTSVVQVSYQYDPRDRLVTLIGNGRVTAFQYDALGRRTNAVWPNGTTAAYAYDEANQLLSLIHASAATTIASFVYAYDLGGNRTNMITLEGTNSYGYDNRNWLTRAEYPDGGVDRCSGLYNAGEWTGTALSFGTGLAGGIKAAGTKAVGKEFSHAIPKRLGGPRSIWNGNYVSAARHYKHDPFRYPSGWRDLGPKWNPAIQQLDRIPNAIKGGAAGAAYGGASQSASSCDCP